MAQRSKSPEDPPHIETTIAAILAAGSAGSNGSSAYSMVQRYRSILIELRRVGGPHDPKNLEPPEG